DGMELFASSTRVPGELGKVTPARSQVRSGEWTVRFEEGAAIPFRLDGSGLHVVSGNRYVVIPREGSSAIVAELVPKPASEVVVTPSRQYAAALAPGGAVGVLDVS